MPPWLWCATLTLAVAQKGAPTIIELQRDRNDTAPPLPFLPNASSASHATLAVTAAIAHTRAAAYMLSMMVLIQVVILLFSMCLCEEDEDEGRASGDAELCFHILALVYGVFGVASAHSAGLVRATTLCLLSALALGRLWYPYVQHVRSLVAQLSRRSHTRVATG